MSELCALADMFDCSNLFCFIHNFYDDCTKLTLSGRVTSLESSLSIKYNNTLHKGGINFSDLSKIINTGCKAFVIYTPEPKKHGIPNAILDYPQVLAEIPKEKQQTRFDRLCYLFKNWGTTRITTYSEDAKLKLKLEKLSASNKAMNNTNNDEYNKYIVRIERTHYPKFALLATTAGS